MDSAPDEVPNTVSIEKLNYSPNESVRLHTSNNSMYLAKSVNKSVLVGDAYTQNAEDSMKGARKMLEELSVEKGKQSMAKGLLLNKIDALKNAIAKIKITITANKTMIAKRKQLEISLNNEKATATKAIHTIQKDASAKAIEVEREKSKLDDQKLELIEIKHTKLIAINEIINERRIKKKEITDQCGDTESLLLHKDEEIIMLKRELKQIANREENRQKYLKTHIHLVETLLDGGRLVKLAYSPDHNKKAYVL